MPIIPTFTPRSARALVIGVVGLLLGIGVVAIIIVLNQQGSLEVDGGDLNLRIKSAEEQIEKNGPILLTSPDSANVAIYLQQVGGIWIAFQANSDGCPLKWNPEAQSFTLVSAENVSPEDCNQDIVFDRKGCVPGSISSPADLQHYATRTDNDKVFVELGSPDNNYCNKARGIS